MDAEKILTVIKSNDVIIAVISVSLSIVAVFVKWFSRILREVGLSNFNYVFSTDSQQAFNRNITKSTLYCCIILLTILSGVLLGFLPKGIQGLLVLIALIIGPSLLMFSVFLWAAYIFDNANLVYFVKNAKISILLMLIFLSNAIIWGYLAVVLKANYSMVLHNKEIPSIGTLVVLGIISLISTLFSLSPILHVLKNNPKEYYLNINSTNWQICEVLDNKLLVLKNDDKKIIVDYSFINGSEIIIRNN